MPFPSMKRLSALPREICDAITLNGQIVSIYDQPSTNPFAREPARIGFWTKRLHQLNNTAAFFVISAGIA